MSSSPACSRECARVSEFVRFCASMGFADSEEAEALLDYLLRADAALGPGPAPVEVVERVALPGTGKRKPSPAEVREAERRAEHERRTNALFGPRPLLAHERAEQRGYEPDDGF